MKKQIKVSVEEDDLTLLEAIATDKGSSVSALGREAIKNFIKKTREKAKQQ